jgi:anti-anti-sigma factor
MTDADWPQREPTVLRIAGELTIFRAVELKQALLAVPAPQEVDLSGVTEIDTAGLQLLILAKRTAQAQQLGLRLLSPSAVVTELFELLGLVAFFADPPCAPPRAGAPAAAQSAALLHPAR